MKYINALFSSVFVLLIVSCSGSYKDTEQATIKLDTNWLFKIGDSVSFKDKNYNDSKWRPIKPGLSWENQGYDYDGFAWYRIKLVIPSKLKRDFSGDSLKIYVGLIDDIGQVFFNGSLIGENNKTSFLRQKLDSAFINLNYPDNKRYMLAVTDPRIMWDKTNVIAIRVFDRSRMGGLLEEDPYLRVTSLADSIEFNKKDFYRIKDDQIVDTNLIVKNFSKGLLKGQLNIIYKTSGSNHTLMDRKFDINLGSNDTISVPVSVPFSVESGKIYFILNDASRMLKVRDSVKISFNLK